MTESPTVYSILRILESRMDSKKTEKNALNLWLEISKMRQENYENWRCQHNLGLKDDADLAWQNREICADVAAVLGIVAFKK